MNNGQVLPEKKMVFGSPVFFLNEQRLLKFPVERPVEKPILVFDINGLFMGRGVGSNCNKTGGCIKIDGKKFDSNHDLLWQYDK